MKIPFNKPYFTGKEAHNVGKCAYTGQISGNGFYTKECHRFFESRFGFEKVLLTSSCTDALEMAALLCDIQPGDEVIMPSYTFVSTANAFALRCAKLVFADVDDEIPNISVDQVEALITSKTKAIVVVHYAGVAVDMDKMMELADKHNLFVVEDAAHAIDSYYKGRALGSIGHFGTFSFHETKNIICGEGGMLAVNDSRFVENAEIIWEKGTNRAAFHRGEVEEYNWVDLGSSFLPSDLTAAFLYSQLLEMDDIQEKRIRVWKTYHEKLKPLKEAGRIDYPDIPDFATLNGNMFYIFLPDRQSRDELIAYLKNHDVLAVFHYLPLHESPYYKDKHDGRALPNTNRFSDTIVRLPFYVELSRKDINYVCQLIEEVVKV
ncbi:MAG: dTDP-4-amino-4,6-dideoxygalactose transaminase [Bacteroidota bacterium]